MYQTVSECVRMPAKSNKSIDVLGIEVQRLQLGSHCPGDAHYVFIYIYMHAPLCVYSYLYACIHSCIKQSVRL